MAIENTYLLGKNITLGCGFDLQAKAPLDSRQTVPAFAGLQALIDGNAAYEGMIVYDEETKKTYQAQLVDDVLAFREFGINEAELKDLIASETTAAMEFKGAATALPENPAKGDMYKVTASFEVNEEEVKVGDSIVYDGEQWFIIPSGDDIEDTWRPVTGVDNDSTLTFVAGDKLEKTVAADGTITYKHATIDAPTNQNSDEDEPTRTYITQLITDNHGHIIGFKTATEVVEDTNTTYEFEGLPVGEDETAPSSVYFQVTSSDAEAAEVIYLDTYSKNEADAELTKKVDKVEGYSLVSDTEIARLAEVDNYDDEEVRGLIGDNADAIDALSEYVGTIPNVPGEDGNNKYADLDVIGYINKKSQETLAAASGNSSETAASVKGQLDDYIGENNTRVKAIEDDVAAIKDAENGILKQAKDYADGLAGNYDEAGAAAGVQTALEAEIAKKVDKETYEADKATFAVAETVNAALDLKANAADVVANGTFESFKTANTQAIADAKAGAVSDVEAKGYAVATEVAGTYATKTELGNVDKKFENYVTSASYATDKSATETALADRYTKEEADGKFALIADAYDDTELAGRVTTAEGKIADLETESAKHALKTDVEAEFAKYTKTADLPTDLGDFTNNAGYAKTADVNTELDKKADKSTVDAMYTNGQIDTAVQGAKDYAKGLVDAIPAQTDYTVTITEDTTDSTIAKRFIFTQLGEEIGRIDLAKELVVTSGSVKEVTVADAPYTGAKVGDKYIELVIANQNTPIYVPAKDLVDIYTAKDGAAEVQVAISSTNEISATLVNGGITEEKLADGVKTKLNKTWEEVGVAKGLVDALADGQVKANKEAIEKLNGADTVDGSVAKSIKDAIAGENLGQYAKTADLGDLAVLDTITADKVTDFVTEVAKVKVNDAAKADEATKATQDGNGKVIADTYAEKATTLAGYGISDAYTKSEVEAMLTWGSF